MHLFRGAARPEELIGVGGTPRALRPVLSSTRWFQTHRTTARRHGGTQHVRRGAGTEGAASRARHRSLATSHDKLSDRSRSKRNGRVWIRMGGALGEGQEITDAPSARVAYLDNAICVVSYGNAIPNPTHRERHRFARLSALPACALVPVACPSEYSDCQVARHRVRGEIAPSSMPLSAPRSPRPERLTRVGRHRLEPQRCSGVTAAAVCRLERLSRVWTPVAIACPGVPGFRLVRT